MGIEAYSTTASANGLTGYYPEDQLAPTLNDAGRQVMADIRAFYDTLDWRDWGLTYTFVSGTSFKVTGDHTAVYHADRRIRATGTLTGTIYGTISSGTLSGGETIVVATWDSGSMSNDGDLALSVGLSATGQPVRSFPSGTRMLFQQNTAPTGWTEETTYFNRGVRQTNSSNWNGIPALADTFTAVFSGSKATDSHVLDLTEIPSHTHPGPSGQSFVVNKAGDDSSGSGNQGFETDTGAAGGGLGHSHTIAMELSYVDVIICVKD